jgi:hypothetical protein
MTGTITLTLLAPWERFFFELDFVEVFSELSSLTPEKNKKGLLCD